MGRILPLIAFYWLCTQPFLAFAQSSPPWREPNEDAIRLFELRMGDYVFEDVVQAYYLEGMLLLPLGGLSQLLSLAIQTSPETGTASGFILREDRRFFLDTSRSEVILSGLSNSYDASLVHLYPDDIYVDVELLAQWLPATFDTDLLTAQITVHPTEPFPLQRRLDRERKSATIGNRPTRERDFPVRNAPYQAWEVPFIDQTVSMSTSKLADGGSESQLQYATYATGDLLYLESAWYLAGNDQSPLDDYRLTLGRTDPNANLLGPLNTRQAAIGHLANPNIPLVSATQLPQPGLLLSNYPLQQQQQYDSHTFQGDLPPGWEVELYHNNTLIGYRQSDAQGQYRFDEVPLLFGNNHFRLVFYGPQGQRREEERTFVLGQSLVPAGEHYYRFLVQNEESGGTRSSVQYSLGLGRHLTTEFSLTRLPDDDPREYQTAGVRSFWKALYLHADVVRQVEAGKAVSAGFKTRIGPLNIAGSDTRLTDYYSELFPLTDDPIARRQELRLDAALPPTFLPRIPLTLEMIRDSHESGRQRTQYRNRMATATRGLAFSNQLTWDDDFDDQEELTGSLQLSHQRNRFGIRGEFFYRLKPTKELSSILLSVDGREFSGYRLSVGLNRSFSGDKDQYIIGLNKSHGEYGLSLDLSYETTGNVALNLLTSFGLGKAPDRNNWYRDARPLAGSGAVSARAFLDANSDGVFNDGEEVLPGVRYTFNGGERSQRSEESPVFITGLPVHQELDIAVAPGSLADPLWVPSLEGVRTVLRPGHTFEIDFPIVETGEVDGVTYLQRRGEERPIGGVHLELVDSTGSVIASAKSAYDGFYLFSKIPAGTYTLRISPEQVDRLNLLPTQPKEIQISPSNLFATNMNFVLRRNPNP